MKIGVSAFAWTAEFTGAHLDILPWLREQQLSALEIPMFDPALLPAANIRRAMEENELACTACAILPPGINPMSPDAATRRRSLEHLQACVETCAEMGAALMGGPVYAPIGYLPGRRATPNDCVYAVECLRSLTPALDAFGVTLALEPVNRSETFLVRTASDARKICEVVDHPRVGITIDTFHANIEEKNTAAAMHSLGSHLKHVHASENDRGLLGSGQVDFASIVSTLRAIDYQGYLMIEGFGYSPLEPMAPGYLWADVCVSPEQIAAAGARYLRGLLM